MVAGHPLGPPAHEQHWVDLAANLAGEFALTAAERDRTGELPVGNLRRLNASGLDVALLPAEYGGQDLSYRSYGAIVRVLSAACPSTACVWVMHIGAAAGLVEMAEPDVARFFAQRLAAGARFANALSEPAGGNLFLRSQQPAVEVEGGFRLSGEKRFSSGCEIADHFLVNAKIDGVSTFFGLDADPATMTFRPSWDAMGLRASGSQLIRFDGTLLPHERRCPPSKRRRPNHIGAGVAALSLGVADGALAALREHARARQVVPGGGTLAEQQWVRFGVGELESRLQAAAMFAQHMCWLADENSPEFLPATMRAKLLANDVAREIADLGVRVGGGSGYLKTSPIERWFRDAQAGWLMAYSAEVCKDVIGSQVLGDDA